MIAAIYARKSTEPEGRRVTAAWGLGRQWAKVAASPTSPGNPALSARIQAGESIGAGRNRL